MGKSLALRIRRTRRFLCGGAVLAAWCSSKTASADPFRYVDRDGHVHEIDSEPSESPVATAPAEPAKDVSFATFEMRAPDGVFPYAALVREASELYSLPPELVFAVMKVESGFNPRAVSRTGAVGLMQLMPSTAQLLGVINSYDPRQNIFGGVKHLRTLINTFNGDVALALAAYNAGAGAVRRAGKIPSIPETQKYVVSVLFFYHSFAAAFAPRPPSPTSLGAASGP